MAQIKIFSTTPGVVGSVQITTIPHSLVRRIDGKKEYIRF